MTPEEIEFIGKAKQHAQESIKLFEEWIQEAAALLKSDAQGTKAERNELVRGLERAKEHVVKFKRDLNAFNQ